MVLNKQNKITINVDPFNTDVSGHWTWMALGKTLLNAAEIHAKARGFGMSSVNSENYTWVLSRLCIEMKKMPKVWDSLIVNTWIDDIYRLFTNRNFSIKNKDGFVYGYAKSVWALIDYNTREIINLSEIHGKDLAQYIDVQEPCPISSSGRVKPIDDCYWVKDIQTSYTDIDINGHVNSIKYIEHILNLFPIKMFEKQHSPKRLEMAYIAEGVYNDCLSFYKKKNDDNTYDVEIRKKNNTVIEKKEEPLVRCKLFFN